MDKRVNTEYKNSSFFYQINEKPNLTHFRWHCHALYELLYVVQGEGKFIVEGAEYPLCPHTVLLLRPYEYHYVCPTSDTPYERYVIHFSQELLLDAAKDLPFVKKTNKQKNAESNDESEAQSNDSNDTNGGN